MSLHSLTQNRRALQLDAQFSAIVFPICSNPLLRIGLETVLAGGSFIIWPETIDDLSMLPDIDEGTPVLFIIEKQDRIDQTLELIDQLKSRHADARLVMLADHLEPDVVTAAWESGVHGFCLSNCRREVLVKSLELVMLGEAVLPSAFVMSITDQSEGHGGLLPITDFRRHEGCGSGGRKLSVREAQILQCLKDGDPNKVIARKLNLSESTVKVHVKAILKKVGACNRTQAALWATRHAAAPAEA
jgi:two-component system nitrate/nitrite response regulator NarL